MSWCCVVVFSPGWGLDKSNFIFWAACFFFCWFFWHANVISWYNRADWCLHLCPSINGTLGIFSHAFCRVIMLQVAKQWSFFRSTNRVKQQWTHQGRCHSLATMLVFERLRRKHAASAAADVNRIAGGKVQKTSSVYCQWLYKTKPSTDGESHWSRYTGRERQKIPPRKYRCVFYTGIQPKSTGIWLLVHIALPYDIK